MVRILKSKVTEYTQGTEEILKILKSSSSTTYYLLILENIFCFKANFQIILKFYILELKSLYGT